MRAPRRKQDKAHGGPGPQLAGIGGSATSRRRTTTSLLTAQRETAPDGVEIARSRERSRSRQRRWAGVLPLPGKVAIMRHTAGADPRDRRLSELVGELSIRSEEFRTRWASHDVRFHNTGTKRFMHPLVGELTLNFERFDLAADSGLTMFTYTAEPGTRSAEGLDLLARWAATPRAPRLDRSHLEQDQT
jgi:hypothetical protein